MLLINFDQFRYAIPSSHEGFIRLYFQNRPDGEFLHVKAPFKMKLGTDLIFLVKVKNNEIKATPSRSTRRKFDDETSARVWHEHVFRDEDGGITADLMDI